MTPAQLLRAAPALLLALLLGCARAPAPPALAGRLEISAPRQVGVGEPVPLAVAAAQAPDGTPVTVVAQGSYGAQVYAAAFSGGRAELTIPSEDMQRAGLLTLLASAGHARGRAEVQVLAGPPVEPVQPLIGPRSVPAGDGALSEAVVIPFDSYGNPVADGTPVEFRTLHPDGRLDRSTVAVSRLVAWQAITPRTRAGRAVVAVTAGAANGPESSFETSPGSPGALQLSVSPGTAPADGRRLLTLRTGLVRDQFGNPMLDGTLITFAVQSPDGTLRFIPAYTLDGVAEALLQAPEAPGTLRVSATLYGQSSPPIDVAFSAGPAAADFPLAAHVNTRDGTVTLAAGALLGQLGQFVPDGTAVRFRITAPSGAERTVSIPAAAGRATAVLQIAELERGAYAAEAVVGSGRGRTTFSVP